MEMQRRMSCVMDTSVNTHLPITQGACLACAMHFRDERIPHTGGAVVRKIIKLTLLGTLGLLLLIQVVPYGRDHSNPPVIQEPSWDSPRTRELAVRACFDCHSNETRWPWYAHVAPVSWLLQWDVDEGRRIVNFSEWHRTYEEASESAETVIEGEMPPWYYLPLHPSAKLSSEEKQELIRGLTATFGSAGH